MKRAAAMLLCPALLFLSSCRAGRYDFRDIEKLELIETLGIDAAGSAVTVTAATGALEGERPTVLINSAYTVGLALRGMQAMQEKDIYFAHVGSCIVGEQTARRGLTMYLDYIERELSVRYSTGLFIVRDGTAADAVSGVCAGGSVTELLEAMKEDVRMLSQSYVYSVGEVAGAMLEKGCALVCAVELREEEDPVSGDRESVLEPSGYALINGDRLEGFLDSEASHGVNILTNRLSMDTVEIPDGRGGVCALSVYFGKTAYKAHFNGNGIPAVVDIIIKLDAGIEELHGMTDPYDDRQLGDIAGALEAVERERVEKALAAVRAYGTDYIGIGRAIERASPVGFSRVREIWPSLLRSIKLNVYIDTEIVRSYDIALPLMPDGERP